MKDHYHVVISTSNAEASGSRMLRVTDKNRYMLKREKKKEGLHNSANGTVV